MAVDIFIMWTCVLERSIFNMSVIIGFSSGLHFHNEKMLKAKQLKLSLHNNKATKSKSPFQYSRV
uniref:Uncharacterized protein n=1 Tax=Glossina pallidipes TaxID=7398 RepID=A0A1B0AC81_GLOPL